MRNHGVHGAIHTLRFGLTAPLDSGFVLSFSSKLGYLHGSPLLLEFADSCLFASFRSLAAWRGFVLVPLPALSSKRFCLHQGGIEITANKPLTARRACAAKNRKVKAVA